MGNKMKQLSVAGLAAVAALAAGPALAQRGTVAPAISPARANPGRGGFQFIGRGLAQMPVLGAFNPGFGSPFANTSYSAALSSMSPYGLGNMTSVTPYGTQYTNSPGLYGMTPYGPGMSYDPSASMSYADPFGGGLRGAAAAIDTQGRFEVMWQQSRLLGQEVERSKVDTRRKIYDEWLYERASRPTLEDEQARSQAYEMKRLLRDPATTDVVSGYALNMLLKDIQHKPGYTSGPPIPLDPKILKQVNVTSSENGGNVGILKFVKDGAQLPWPLPLQGSAYQKQTQRLNHLAAEAVDTIEKGGEPNQGTLKDMMEDVNTLKSMVSANINELTPSQSVEAKRFLNQLDDAIHASQQRNVGNYFTDRWAAKGKTVADLVGYMTANGLKFAPAVTGDEAAYAALYSALAGYRRGLETEVAREGGK